jgi:hypothetical protein
VANKVLNGFEDKNYLKITSNPVHVDIAHPKESQLIDALNAIDINNVTPLEAHKILCQLKKDI